MCETRRQEPSGDENIALGGDGSCKEAGLDEVINNVPGAYKTKIAPELECDEGEHPSLITGIYQHHLFVPTNEGRVYNGDPRLTIPWCEINGTTLTLKRLERLVENEYVELQLNINSTLRQSLSIQKI